MKNQEQANNNNNLNDPTVANDPQAQVNLDDLPISGEQEEQVKGGATNAMFNNGVLTVVGADTNNITMGDGSVRFITDSLPLPIYR